ncbi:MAG TPA: gliding motility-associated C-terminal domain-containing protein [Saprospiraceae bacterium]|nr:gliding motility-associated C-terminal domain-containing protein [Saprospiraceae bacterium]
MMTPRQLRFFTTVFTFFSLLTLSKAQDTIIVSFDCGQVMLGDQICIPVNIENFTNVTTFSLLITWDPLVLDFASLQNEVFSGGAWNVAGPNDLRYIWSDLLGNGQNLPDGTTLFEVCFEAIGVPSSTSIVNAPAFVLNPFNTTEFANPDAEAIPFTTIPCFVEVINPVTVAAILSACGSPDGIANGSFMITAAGGAAPYDYTWSGPVSGNGILPLVGSSAIQSVPPGNYTITITDANSVSQMYMITITTEELMPVITVIRQVTCFDFSNGRIEVGAFGGTHPISVIWQNTTNPVYAGSGFLNSSGDVILLNSLPVGDYIITLIDERGCLRQGMVNLSASPIIIDAIPTNATCLGATDGTVSVSFSGGRPYVGGVYEVMPGWSGGSFMTTSPVNTAPVLGPGDYWIEVCDSINGCCVRDTFTVGADVVISANLLEEAPTCAGVNDGRVRVTGLTDGAVVGPYNIQLFNFNKVALGPAVNNVILVQYTNLASGNYFVVVKEGICRSDTLPIVIPAAVPMVINVLSVKPSGCISGQGTGEISVMASGGNPGYTYTWDGGAFMGSMITGVTAGSHFLTVTDANGCTGQLTVSVPQATGPMIETILASNIGCTGGNVTLEVVFTSGTAPVEVIDWSTGDSTAIITGVGPGNVTVLIRDSLFCFDLASFNVPDMAVLRLDSVRVENPTCIGDADGQFTVFASQGLEPYTYIWSTGDTTTFNLLPGLTAGTYSVTIIDADTCDIFVDTTIVLSDPVAPTFVFSAIADASCSDTCDGSVTLIPAGGLPATPFTFFWNAGLIETAIQSTALDLCPGYQSVLITQDNLCFYEDSILISAPAPLSISTLTLSDVSCFGVSDGMLSIEATGGTGPYTFDWDALPPGSIQNQLSAGIYTVTVTDLNGCTVARALEIFQPDSLVLEIDSSGLSPVSCNSVNSGIITLQVTGGNGGYGYVWDPPVSTSFIATGVTAGTYQITVTDASGCRDIISITMTGPSPVMSFLPMIDDPACFGGLTPVTVESATGGNGGYTWNINGGQVHELDSIVELPAGIYNIITQDSTGCRDTVQIFIDNPPPLEIIILPEEPIIELGDSIMLQVLIQGMQVQIDSVSWVSNGPLSCYDCPEPIAMNVVPTVYTVTVWDENGCSATLDVLVDVDNQREVFIPNVFSPNFDGRNDVLMLFTGQGIVRIPSMRIFDRWGEMIVEEKDLPPLPGGIVVWDGSFRDKEMVPGVYVYFIEVEFANGEVLRYRGDVTLLR